MGVTMNTAENHDEIFPRGEKASPDYFTGTALLKMLVPADDIFNTSIANVVFEPGARNNWHTHPGGQILIVTHGKGYYQEKGKPIQKLQKGDVVKIPPGIVHWHGAAQDCEFIHLAINTNTSTGLVDWLQPVTDDEYNGVTE